MSKSLYEKLLTIKTEVPFLKPNERGFNYDYANPSRVLGVFNPLFNRFKILLIPKVISNEPISFDINSVTKGANPTQVVKTEILHNLSMEFTFVDVETGEKLVIPWYGTGNNGIEQGYGSALTYALRYFLLSFFNVPVDKEDPNYIQSSKKAKSETINEEELVKLTSANARALINALKKGTKSPMDVRNKLSEYKDDGNKQAVEEFLNAM